ADGTAYSRRPAVAALDRAAALAPSLECAEGNDRRQPGQSRLPRDPRGDPALPVAPRHGPVAPAAGAEARLSLPAARDFASHHHAMSRRRALLGTASVVAFVTALLARADVAAEPPGILVSRQL